MAVFALVLTTSAATVGRSTARHSPFGGPPHLSPLAAESSSDTSVIIGLTVAQTDPVRPTLDLRGRSVDRNEPGTYEVDAHVSRIPCPGEYQFHAATEDTSNGNSSSYSALLRLFDPSPRLPGAHCGRTPPPHPGRMSVRLQDRTENLFTVKGGRSNAGAFEGRLDFSSVPECDKTYTLDATLDLAGLSRRVEFNVRAIELNVNLPGRATEDKRC
jgi:hypothetical protein